MDGKLLSFLLPLRFSAIRRHERNSAQFSGEALYQEACLCFHRAELPVDRISVISLSQCCWFWRWNHWRDEFQSLVRFQRPLSSLADVCTRFLESSPVPDSRKLLPKTCRVYLNAEETIYQIPLQSLIEGHCCFLYDAEISQLPYWLF